MGPLSPCCRGTMLWPDLRQPTISYNFLIFSFSCHLTIALFVQFLGDLVLLEVLEVLFLSQNLPVTRSPNCIVILSSLWNFMKVMLILGDHGLGCLSSCGSLKQTPPPQTLPIGSMEGAKMWTTWRSLRTGVRNNALKGVLHQIYQLSTHQVHEQKNMTCWGHHKSEQI